MRLLPILYVAWLGVLITLELAMIPSPFGLLPPLTFTTFHKKYSFLLVLSVSASFSHSMWITYPLDS